MPSLNWAGKDKVINHHLDVPMHVLERAYGFDKRGRHEKAAGSGNMIIHGDNLAALKALLPRYEGRVDCIYIDPPYNTGNEGWVYNDNVNDPQIKKWLGEVVGKEGEDFSRHDKWLCMMYPRLRLLHKLLSPNGVIFISIDDNEQARLRLVLDEIFGSEKFIGTIAWESKTKCQNTLTARRQFQRKWEYVLVYKNRPGRYEFRLKEIGNYEYDLQDDKGPYRSKKIEQMSASGMRGRETMVFPILGVSPRTGFQWKLGKDTIDEFSARGDLELKNGKPYLRIRPEDDSAKCEPFWSFLDKSFGTGESAHKELTTIIGRNDFETVKPHQLIEYLIDRVCDKNAIILDSFAGSGTTAHSVLKMNAEDGGNRRFILVELMDYAENITAERVKRVIQGYGSGDNAQAGTGGSFDYFELGPALMDGDTLNEALPVEMLREYVWWTETHAEYGKADPKDPYLLGSHNGTAYYFCYERGRTVALNRALLRRIKAKAESYVVFADTCLLDEATLRRLHITFKKIPRDITRP